jgi:ribonuclease R/exosome complex exonuclease DIS3/RRP44
MSKKKRDIKKLEKKIYSFLKSNPSKGYNYKQISSCFDIKDTKTRNFIIRILSDLQRKGKIELRDRGRYFFYPIKIQTKEGKLNLLPTGKGVISFVDETQDCIVPKRHLNKGLDGDTVSVSFHNKKDGKEAHIEKIIERKRNEYVGILQIKKDFGFVLCKKGKMYTDLFIEEKDTRGFKDGDKVVAIFSEWERGKDSPNGKIIKSLGQPGEKDTEMHAILHEYELPYEFDQATEKEAIGLSREISLEEIKKRRDIRKTLTFTIDPKSAKDFDDAISFKIIDEGLFEIGIHIADVSHYVKANSQLDKEAHERATSVYLVDRVVPMLPEVLSNELCSLKPREEKYTFSAVFNIDIKGKIKKEWYGKTVIYSDQRFSYEEVQHMLDNQTNKVSKEVSLSGKEYKVEDSCFEALNILNNVAKELRAERLKKGGITFDRVEVNFELNEENKPEKVFFKTSKEANKLIEEFMLLANKKVSLFMGKKNAAFSSVYRVHDQPDEEKLYNLKQTVSTFGYDFNLTGNNTSAEINRLLKNCNGKKEQNMIDTLTLRSMSKAEYTTNNIGHYGLGFSHYTHFTSPIRRYPDILIHRLLQSFIEKKRGQKKEILEDICKHASYREQLATKAERDSTKYMQMVFMEDKIGGLFKGIISGVTDRGMYVELVENKCEGMIRIKDLKNDYFSYDMRTHSIIGEKSKKIYRLGDSLLIKVKKVDIVRRFLDFLPAD